ncbi:MAG: hypothetical protein H6970_11935 [Gammaproteobacteria bacterium]|nr:hypothetical protein [Gammaproteobacteria bacterium]MCP5425756.1 hypothetical protein [Gammaproteobacteria bacterium]MCP5458633.1 hypothetical protein [Gammaproteobacteria bacterium]
MKQRYFDQRGDLTRCPSGQHLRIWAVWRLSHTRRAQPLGPRPRWSELAICWLFHRATGVMLWLMEIRRRLRRWLG